MSSAGEVLPEGCALMVGEDGSQYVTLEQDGQTYAIPLEEFKLMQSQQPNQFQPEHEQGGRMAITIQTHAAAVDAVQVQPQSQALQPQQQMHVSEHPVTQPVVVAVRSPFATPQPVASMVPASAPVATFVSPVAAPVTAANSLAATSSMTLVPVSGPPPGMLTAGAANTASFINASGQSLVGDKAGATRTLPDTSQLNRYILPESSVRFYADNYTNLLSKHNLF